MKRSIKQALSLLLTIAMLASLVIVPAAAADKTGAVGDEWDFSTFKDTTAYPTTYEGSYDGLTLKNVGAHSNGYANFNSGGTIEVPVAGPCNVEVMCQYGNGGTVGDQALKNDEYAVYSYKENTTGTVTIARTDGNVYVRSIKITELKTDPAVVAEDEVIVKVGATTTLDVTLANAEGKTATWAYSVGDDTVATVAEDEPTVTGVKAGKTTVTITATVDGKDYTKDVTVYVQPTQIVELTEDIALDFTGNNGKETYLTNAYIAYTGAHSYKDTSHGVWKQTGITLKVPAGKMAEVKVKSCQYNNEATLTYADGTVVKGTETDPIYTVTGVKGEATITCGGTLYIHGIDVKLMDATTPVMTVSPAAVSMRAGETKDVTVTAENYAAEMKPFAVSADEEIATVAVKDNTVTVTGVKEGATEVYVVMADTQPDLTAAKADKDAKVVAVTVSAALPEGVKEWKFLDEAEFEASKTELTFSDGVTYHGVTYGLYFKPGATIGVPVDGPSKITLWVGYEWNVGVGTKQNGAQYGSIYNKGDKGNKSDPFEFTYTGGKGTACVTALPGFTSYISGVRVEPLKDVTPNSVVAWDFGAEALDESLFVNKLTVENINAQYPAGAKDGDTIPAEGFNFYDGALKFNTNEKTNNRLRSTNDALIVYDSKSLTGAQGADPYAATEVVLGEDGKTVVGGETYTGYVYSNSSNQPLVNLTIKLTAGDKVTFMSGSNGNPEHYELKAPSGAIESGEFLNTAKAEPLTFYAKETGEYTYYGTNADTSNAAEKLVVARIYQEPGVKVAVSGTVTAPANIPNGYALVFTGPGGVETTAKVGTDGKYTAELNNYLSGAEYTVSLKDADGFVVGVGDTLTLGMADRAATHDVTVAAVDLVKVSGKVAGLTEADMANLVLTVNKPEDKIYTPKILPAADGSYTASFEKGVAYTLTADFVNDYDLVKSDLTYTADTAENIIFSAKPTFAVTMASDPAGVDMSAATITFTNINDSDEKHPDGYTYTFTGTEGIALRNGQYKVKVEGVSAIQKLTPDFVVDGADNTCTVPFIVETPTLWDFSDATWNPDVAATNAYNGLVLSGVSHNKTYALTAADSTIQVPVDGPCTVTVSYCYKAAGTVGDVAFSTESGSTGTIETASYKYTGEKGTVEIKTTGQTYFTKIEVTKNIPYAATVTVGADKTYKTINEALAAVASMDRPNNERVTIVIDPGDYEEQLIVRSDNVTLKNASADAKLELTNKGVGIGANEVRITWYYGHGYNYYSMTKGGVYDADVLAVNKANGYASYNNGGGNQGDTLWNSTVSVFANGFEADGIIFENSFNQYQSKKAAEDVIVPQTGAAKEGAVPRAEMKAGDTTVQQKAYVERAAALGIGNNYGQASFNNCAFIGRQDVLFGGTGTTAAFYACDLYGGTDYIMGPMTAAFAKCNLIMNTSEGTTDVCYITAPQQAAGARGYLFYNCTVTSTEPGVNTASAHRSKPGTFGRPWTSSGEAVFYKTNVEATDPVYYGDDVTSTSLIQPAGWTNGLGGFKPATRMGEQDTIEYFEGVDNTQARKDAGFGKIYTTGATEDEAKVPYDPEAWFGDTTWKPFEGKDLTVVEQTPKAFTADVLKEELVKAIAKATAVHGEEIYTVSADTTAADVDRGTKFVAESGKTALKTAIDAAQAVVDATSATADQVFAAQKDLATAVKAYQDAVKTGAKAPDTAALAAAIKAAEDKMAGVVTSEGPADKVAKDVKFATKAEMDAIKAALNAAKTALASTSNTQADVDKATTDLTAATTAFVPKTGTKAADPASLKAAIEAAKADKEGVIVNAGPADQVDSGVKFVPAQSVIDALDKAIAAAEAVANKTNATQAELDKALKDLTIATVDFNASVQTGTKGGAAGADKTALTEALTAAKGVYAIGDDVKVMPAGTKTSDVTKGDKFVTQDLYDALAKAIADAEAVLADENATEQAIADAVAALNAAKDALKIQTGTKGGSSPSYHGGGGGGGGATTTTKTNTTGGKTTKTVNSSGTTYTVKDKSGEEIAKVTIPKTIPSVGYKFIDVPDDHWAAKSINNIAGLGMVKGVDDEKHIYDMTSATTRGAVATILYRVSNGKAGISEAFADVEAGQWYTDGIAWAAKVGIVNGYSAETFAPNDPVTREQLAVMLYRYAGLLALDTAKKGDVSAFTDADSIDDWASEAMTWAVGVGILQGDETKALNPTDNASRAETACMLDRFVALLK